MHLTIHEEERIQLWGAAEMARRRLERGVKLNSPEAIALICDEVLERARDNSIPMLVDLVEYDVSYAPLRYLYLGGLVCHYLRN